MSCTLPGDYQQKMFNKIEGLENAKLIQFGKIKKKIIKLIFLFEFRLWC